MIDNRDIIKAETIAADIKICSGCDMYHSHSRGFAVPDKRTIHYSAKGSTRKTLYGFLHEIGHIVKGHGKACKLRRFEREAEAEEYARKSLRDYGIAVPRKAVVLGNAYIRKWKRFGDSVSKAHRHKWQFLRDVQGGKAYHCACGAHSLKNSIATAAPSAIVQGENKWTLCKSKK